MSENGDSGSTEARRDASMARRPSLADAAKRRGSMRCRREEATDERVRDDESEERRSRAAELDQGATRGLIRRRSRAEPEKARRVAQDCGPRPI